MSLLLLWRNRVKCSSPVDNADHFLRAMFFKQERLVLSILLIIAILLPIGSMFLFLFARILHLFGDPVSGFALDIAAICFASLWVIDFIAMVFVIALRLIYPEKK